MRRQPSVTVLHTDDGFVRITHDKNTGTYRMGFKSGDKFQWKFISETLFCLMAQELANQSGRND